METLNLLKCPEMIKTLYITNDFFDIGYLQFANLQMKNEIKKKSVIQFGYDMNIRAII